jgi:two-component system, NtrC family, response regulator AtoC
VNHGTDRKTVLVAEDDREVRECLAIMLRCQGYEVITACDGEEAVNYFTSGCDISAVVLDMMMPNKDGLAALREIRQVDADVPIITLSGLSTPLSIVNAIKSGATDFLSKPVNHEELGRVLRNAMRAVPADQSVSLRTTAEAPSTAATRLASGDMFFGRSPAMMALRSSLPTVAASNVPILIEGETGSGKEMLARQIHNLSPFAGKPFVKLNCAAVPSELMESELFGYERGAFTGAFQRKPGVFELADGGTLLLDEIGDMDIRLQAKLLQVLQDQEFRRLGGRETIRVQVRVLSATHCNLRHAVAEKSFREDLYYRLNVFTLTMPALRERREDIVAITEFLMRKHAAPASTPLILTDRLKTVLSNYSWPGNIRQLENTVRKLVVLRDPELIAAEIEAMSGTGIQPVHAAAIPPARSLEIAPSQTPLNPTSMLAEVARAKNAAETEVILAALNATHWNRKLAAARLQIDYKAFLYKMRKLSIEDQARAEPVSA